MKDTKILITLLKLLLANRLPKHKQQAIGLRSGLATRSLRHGVAHLAAVSKAHTLTKPKQKNQGLGAHKKIILKNLVMNIL